MNKDDCPFCGSKLTAICPFCGSNLTTIMIERKVVACGMLFLWNEGSGS